MILKCLAVDDEPLALDIIEDYITKVDFLELEAKSTSAIEALKIIKEKDIDLIFLDIQMPVLDGFGVVRKLVETGDVPLIIFTTAYDQYAIKAFEINAVDYLLKPVERDRLEGAIERAKTIMPSRGEYVEKLRKLTEGIHVGQRFLPRIVVRKEGGMDLIETDRVAMLEKRGPDVIAHTDAGDFITNYADLDELEVQLDPVMFLRLGSEGIVNLARIGKIVPWSGGHYVMTLDDGSSTEIKLTRTQAQILKNKAEGK